MGTTGTSFSEIYDIFLTKIEDYKIDLLYTESEERFYAYLFGFLKLAIADFSHICSKNLESYSDNSFIETLSILEQKILGERMVLYWLSKNISDIRQMNLKIQDKDFKTFAEANNLASKQKWLGQLEEQSDLAFTKYQLQSLTPSDWL